MVSPNLRQNRLPDLLPRNLLLRSISPPAPIKQSSKMGGVRSGKATLAADSDVRIAAPKPVLRALKPPVPLFNSESKPSVTIPEPVLPPMPVFPRPVSKNAALRQLAAPPAPVASSSKLPPPLKSLAPPPPPAPSAPAASSSKLLPLKPPLPPASASLTSDRTLRTISTTLIARATDLFTDNGASELASILLHDQHPDIQFPSTDDFDERRGIMMSPEKGGKGREKFVRNGLATVQRLYSTAHTPLSHSGKQKCLTH
ncbi:hypothetical protein B0H14DRAFT_1606614 [Mycena olivaceomarginata]|nr:hypothetical protein B0H14DRAFT_1606614 [Mycena olivaceomarginata]